MMVHELTGEREIPVASAVPDERNGFANPPIALLGVAFDPVTLPQAVNRIEAMVASRQPHYVVTANVDFLVQARADPELHRIFLEAPLVLCDGTPLVWASRLLGNPLPERVAGADVVPELIRLAARKKYRLFCLGASEESGARAVANIRARFPGLEISHYSPPFRPWTEADHEEILRRIGDADPDMLFVAFGCPKAEKWIAKNYRALGVPVVIGVGATIDFLAGYRKRAPIWMQRAGIEWVYRLLQEPRRLFKRYCTDLWHFSGAISRQWWQLKWRAASDRGANRGSIVGLAPEWQRVQASERLNRASVEAEAALWQKIAGSPRHCLLDLAGVKTIDSTGVALLVGLQKQLRVSGRALVLLAPSATVCRALRLLRLQDHLHLHPRAL